jgi:glycosyltransferase involved in cell wall biosynthesis
VRILAVANHLGALGGLERTQLTMCRSLAARGHRVDLVYQSMGNFGDDWRAFAGTMVQIERSLPSGRTPVESSLAFLRAVNETRHLDPDVIYAYRPLDIPLAVGAGTLCSAPVVLHLCLPRPPVLPFLVRRGLARVAMTLSVSHDTAELWRRKGIPAGTITVVHTGIDMGHYVPASAEARLATRIELGLDPDAFMILYAGRIGRIKGVDHLVRAFRRLAGAKPHARLVVVGGPSLSTDPAEAARYAAELRALAGPADVVWLEPRSDVLSLIQAADVAVVPSVWSEPFSRSVIEPLACGVPVIASRVGGNPEILTGWTSDFLVPPGDAGALATAISALDGWRKTDPDLGERCRQSVVDRLALGREVDCVESLLGSIARRSS